MSPTGSPLERPPMFRRRRFDASHRRPSVLRAILRPLALALLVVGTPAALGVWVLTSPRFALREIEIASGARVAEEWVAENLAPLRGRHVLLLSLPEVERRLATHGWIQGVEVRKRLPDALVVEVLERVPVAVLRHDGDFHYVDRRGNIIDRLEEGAEPALLLIESLSTENRPIAAAVEAIAELVASGTAHFGVIDRVELLTGADLELSVPTLPFTVLVRGDRLDPAIAQFEQLLPGIRRRFTGLSVVDLRFSRQIVMQFPEA